METKEVKIKNIFVGREKELESLDILWKDSIDTTSEHLVYTILNAPGVGKTTLANLIAQELDRPFYTLSATNSGVKDVREVIQKATSLGLFGKDIPILFIDEIHRFSKAQQDSLLGAVEKDGNWNFDSARELILFCNGLWCGQSPRAIKSLLKIGYPSDKLFWYRGGMQAWQLLGLSTVTP